MANVIAVLVAVTALAATVFGMVWWRRRRARRAFDAEYVRLVEETQIDLKSLHGPGAVPTAARAAVKPAQLAAGPLNAADLRYYESCWDHIESEFGESPAEALDLAEHLTANLLLTRGLAPADSPQPSELPATWSFPSARGYRQAQRECARALAAMPQAQQQLPTSRLRTALGLYRAFFEEIINLPTKRGSEI